MAGAAAFAPAAGPVHPHVDVLPPGPCGAGRRRGLEDSRPAEARSLLAQADRDARRLEREGMPCPAAYARVIRGAGGAPRRSRAAVLLLEEAAVRFEAVDMRLCSAAARRRQGEMIGGETGRSMIDREDDWMASQRIQDPARMAAMILPRFAESD